MSKRNSESEIASEWVRQGGDPKYATMMAKIALRESGGNAASDNSHTGPGGGKLNKNGTVDTGTYAVNDVWRKDPVIGPMFRDGSIRTLAGSTKAAIHILKVQGPKAWATYNAATDAKFIGKSAMAQHAASLTSTRTTPAVPGKPGGVDTSQAIVDTLIGGNHKLGHLGGPSLLSRVNAKIATGAYTTAPTPGTPARTTKDLANVAAGGSTSSTAPSGPGKFTVTGADPGRLQPSLIAFAKKVAAQFGQPLTGDSGATHSKMTVDGNVSQHYTGNATDIPATGAKLLAMGRAALIAAGMPKAQAMKQTGGLFNVGAHQIIFLTNQGGNHFNHLHISAR